MRWRKPKDASTRKVLKFLWFPTSLFLPTPSADKELRWLERAWVLQVCHHSGRAMRGYWWIDKEWVDE